MKWIRKDWRNLKGTVHFVIFVFSTSMISILNNIKKSELKLIAQELGQTVPIEARMSEIKIHIEDTDIFKTDPEFLRGINQIDRGGSTTETDEEQSKLEPERVRLERVRLPRERVRT
ncbi:hypothetical protein NPIL_544521 [Nephila pilipes]|uniref:Uncharacterized protein n=1 Tax=Nephila pilipes TaxID=299642 RepID=A0A8X6QW00_NEPPI|nr:hypothetical protein NPIL_544521 [Nephila pilipes]